MHLYMNSTIGPTKRWKNGQSSKSKFSENAIWNYLNKAILHLGIIPFYPTVTELRSCDCGKACAPSEIGEFALGNTFLSRKVGFKLFSRDKIMVWLWESFYFDWNASSFAEYFWQGDLWKTQEHPAQSKWKINLTCCFTFHNAPEVEFVWGT